MKLVPQSHVFLGTNMNVSESWKTAEQAARTCYQSARLNNDESSEEFCKRILLQKDNMKANHTSPLAISAVYLYIEYIDNNVLITPELCIVKHYQNNKYSKVVINSIDMYRKSAYITTNLRVIIENNWQNDLEYSVPPMHYHIKRYIFKMITSVQVMSEITRHTTLSFCCESSRYCNYNLNKFGKELTFIEPIVSNETAKNIILISNKNDEDTYLTLINDYKCTPQDAAYILPKGLKTTIMMAGYEDDLLHMFNLRYKEISGPVLPYMKQLMEPMYKEFNDTIKNNIWNQK